MHPREANDIIKCRHSSWTISLQSKNRKRYVIMINQRGVHSLSEEVREMILCVTDLRQIRVKRDYRVHSANGLDEHYAAPERRAARRGLMDYNNIMCDSPRRGGGFSCGRNDDDDSRFPDQRLLGRACHEFKIKYKTTTITRPSGNLTDPYTYIHTYIVYIYIHTSIQGVSG